jgi:hypothetical protein
MINGKIPGIDHPINTWLKANDNEKLQLVYDIAVMMEVLILMKHFQALLPMVAPTKPQNLTQNNKMIVNFGNEANKIHPVNIDTKDIVKYVLGIMTEEDASKSCKFEYDDINLPNPLKVTVADGSETTWSPDKR